MKVAQNPRIAIAGSVNSSKKVMEKLIEHKMNVVLAFGLDPEVSENVSGFKDLKPVAESGGLPFYYFKKLNDEWVVDLMKSENVDLFFVIGLSQLVREPLLSLPTYGCIGYHPTLLPEGRGRGAIAWIILGKAKPAASFFVMDKGADSGPLLAQEPVDLKGDEYPQEVIDKILKGIDRALDKLLPDLKKGAVELKEQDHSKATYLGKRAPDDGYINWNDSAEEIALLVRAVSSPLPGAFTFYKGQQITIWKASVKKDAKFIGVPGRILESGERAFLIQTGDGVLEVLEYKGIEPEEIRVGRKLGINLIAEYRKIFRK